MKLRESVKAKLSKLRAQVVDVCETCKGEGYLPYPGQPGSLMRCRCMINFKYLMELTIAGIPQDYWSLTLAKMQIDEKYKSVVQLYLSHLDKAMERGLGLVLTGPNGVGKTSVMCHLGCRAIVHGYDVRYFSLAHFITAVQKNNQEFIDDINQGQMLLIDELDKKYSKKGSDYVIKTFDEHLRGFLGDRKVVIIATNWSTTDVQRNFGDSLLSLMKRRCEFVEMVGEDFSNYVNSSYWERLKKDTELITKCVAKYAVEREAKCG